jgi:hypothetical protein
MNSVKFFWLGVVAIVVVLIAKVILSPRFGFGRPNSTVDLSRPAVVQRIQSLQRLETAQFTIEKIIEAGTEGNAFQEVLYGDRLLLIAHGQVIAGFDLSTVSDEAVEVRGTSLKLTLPAPQVLVTKLDSQQTKVYDRRLGILSKGDKDLESEARKQAEMAIQQAACESRILDTAAQNGRHQLIQFFSALGFEEVEVIIPSGSC